MNYNGLTGEQYDQMFIDLENGTFVPTANEGAPQPLYYPYSCWEELLGSDDLAFHAVTGQYAEFIRQREQKDAQD